MNILRMLPRFRGAYSAVEGMARREEWPRGQIEEYQLDELNRLWQHAINHVPYYRNLHRQNVLPDRFCNLDEFRERVPLLPKSVVRQHSDEFLSEVPRRGCWEATSGSTGTPTRLYHDVAGHLRMQHAKYRLYGAWGVDILDPMAYLWDRPGDVKPFLCGVMLKSKMRIKDALRRRKRISAYNLDKNALHACLRGIERFRPRAIYGFSNAVYMLAQAAGERGFSSDGLKAVIMTSEVATPRMREIVQQSFGAPAVVEYGATECELIAGQYPDGTLRVREDMVLLEALPRSTAGCELVLTVLTNWSFPLIRYRIEDLTDVPLEFPAQGFAILRGGIAGRSDDLLRTRSGGCLHPAGIATVFEHHIDSPAVRRYRVHQDRTGALDVEIEVGASRIPSIDVEDFRRQISKLVDGYPVNVRLTTRLTASRSSKHRAITSDLSSQHPLEA